MCLAMLQPAGSRLKNEWLSNSFRNNPDGAGIAYIKDGKVEISKGIFKEAELVKQYNKLHEAYGKDNAMLVHVRIATAGKISKDNCHPFPIKGGAMIHNGHLWSVKDGTDAEKSDTREFSQIFYNILDYDSVCKAIDEEDFEESIGYDKMAFLYDDGSWTTAGHFYEQDGCKFSNTGYTSNSFSEYVAQGVDDWDWRNWR